MKVERSPEGKKFKPFSITIHFEENNDVSLFYNLLNKLESEVKPQGIYFGIIQELKEKLDA